MRSLIILAHPSSKGFSRSAADSYKKAVEAAGGEAEILDLYGGYRQDYLVFENMQEIRGDAKTKEVQEKILAADELVFCFPVWWLRRRQF